MSETLLRRRLLKLVSISASASAGSGLVSANSDSAGSGNPHELENDLKVKDVTDSPGELTVEFLRSGQQSEFTRDFDFNLEDETASPRIKPVENVDIKGNGRYVVRVETPSDVTAKPLDVPPGGIQPASTILISRYPEEVRVSVVLR